MTRQTAAPTDGLPETDRLLPDDALDRVRVSQAQALALLRKCLPDADATEDLEPFLCRVYRDRTVLGIGDLLTAYFADCMIPFEPAR